jgi:hypothetical protein
MIILRWHIFGDCPSDIHSQLPKKPQPGKTRRRKHHLWHLPYQTKISLAEPDDVPSSDDSSDNDVSEPIKWEEDSYSDAEEVVANEKCRGSESKIYVVYNPNLPSSSNTNSATVSYYKVYLTNIKRETTTSDLQLLCDEFNYVYIEHKKAWGHATVVNI